MATVMSGQEFERSYTLKERYYLTANKEQRVERTLTGYYQGYAGFLIATENYNSMSKSGDLYRIAQQIRELESPTDKCIKCRYRIGNYTGDPGYLLYVIFKTRIRLKFLEFKYRFTHLNIINLIFGSKSSRIK